MLLTRLGPYRIGKSIGKGGMGSVYEATDVETGQRVAIKALSPHLAQVEGFRERFDAEIESLKTLRHEGIVRLYGYGEQDGVLFYSMEMIAGTSLEDELRAGRRFNWREVTDVAIQLSMALKHAHDHGIIHRDIKPANILFADETRVKLADFGIARLFGNTNSLTTAGGVLGTADYMSPEQADGRPVSARCDQYSLGGVMYALLAGRPPFRAKNLPEMLQLQRFAEPEPVSRYAPDTPKQLEQVIGQLLAKDPADRFPNTHVLARHLQAMVRALSRPAAEGFAVRGEPAGPSLDGVDISNSLALAVTQAESDVLPSAAQLPPLVPQVANEAAPPPNAADAAARSAEKDREAKVHVAPAQASAPRASGAAAKTAPPTGPAVFTSLEEERARAAQYSRSWTAVAAPLAGLALFVAVLGGVAVTLFRPSTSDELYARISDHADEEDVNSIREVRQEIDDFLERFPDDLRAAELRRYQLRMDLDSMHRRLQLQARRSGIADPDLLPVEVLYLQAMDAAGTAPDEAVGQLELLVKLYGEGAMADATAAPGNEDAVELEERRLRCVQLAQRQIELLRSDSEQLAARQLAALRERLAAAERLALEHPHNARDMYRAMVDLYGDKEWAREVVGEAERRLSLDKEPGRSEEGETSRNAEGETRRQGDTEIGTQSED